MKLKLTSDGTPMGTKLVNVETGEPVEHIVKLEWSVTADTVSKLEVTLLNVPIEVDGQWEIKETATTYRYEQKMK